MSAYHNALIFGGKGFIGSHLISFLKKNVPELDVYVADILADESNPCEYKVDVRNPINLDGKFGADTIIFNFAAVHRTPGHPDKAYFETNIRGAENVCAFAEAHGINNIVFTSSIAPYGASEDVKTEETLPTPNTPYGISKLVAEKIHQMWLAGDSNRKLSIARPGIVFGTGEHGNMTRLYAGLKKHRFAYAGRKDTIKANIYVKDLVRVMWLMANDSDRFQLYNCCSYPAPTIETIVKAMLKATKMNRCVPYIPQKPMMFAAGVGGMLGGLGLGICPDRVKKLMVSTNICGKALSEKYPLEFSLEDAFADWFKDCDGKVLE